VIKSLSISASFQLRLIIVEIIEIEKIVGSDRSAHLPFTGALIETLLYKIDKVAGCIFSTETHIVLTNDFNNSFDNNRVDILPQDGVLYIEFTSSHFKYSWSTLPLLATGSIFKAIWVGNKYGMIITLSICNGVILLASAGHIQLIFMQSGPKYTGIFVDSATNSMFEETGIDVNIECIFIRTQQGDNKNKVTEASIKFDFWILFDGLIYNSRGRPRDWSGLIVPNVLENLVPWTHDSISWTGIIFPLSFNPNVGFRIRIF